jgi:fluoroacetyl-CoA thioesterase
MTAKAPESECALKPGVKGHHEHVVEDRHCTQRGRHKIFSTPNMVQLLEWAAIDALKPYLTEGQISVGTHIDVRHLAPTLKGMKVRAEAVVHEVAGARVLFEVEIFDEVEKVGAATHERFVLDLDRYVRRLEKKAAGAAPPGK